MRKLLVILLTALFIAGCGSNDKNEENNTDSNNQATENNEQNSEQADNEDKSLYQVGETAQVTSGIYDFPFEITVNDYEVTDEVEGESIGDYITDPDEEDAFVVVNTTIKNTGEESFVPDDKISAQLLGEMTSATDYKRFFKERQEKLESGEEITGNVVYTPNGLYESDVVYFTYEAGDPNEVQFELPVPDK